MLQPNLRVVDAATLDVEALVDELADWGANAVLLNGGGMVAWYPTALSYQHRPEGLTFDFVDRAVAAARQRGLRTLLRIDATKTYPEHLKAHPDWFRVGPDGGPVRVGPFFETCMNGPFWQRHCFEMMTELLRYETDGIFLNSFLYRGCEARCAACERVLENVRERLGVAADDPLVRRTWMAEFAARLQQAVSAQRPAATVAFDMEVLTDDPRHRASAGWSRRLWSVSRPIVAIAFNRVTRPQPIWHHQAGEDARLLASVAPGASPLVHVTYSAIFGNRRAAQPPDQLAHDLIQAAANGAGVGVQIPGTLAQDDRRSLEAVRSIFEHLAANDATYARARPAARVALVQSQETLERLGADDPVGRHLQEYRGWYESLVQGHLPFDVIDDEHLEDGDLDRYEVLVLPNVAVLSDDVCRRLDAFVRGGGGIVATHETSLRRPDGVRRPDLGLRSLGRRYVRTIAAPGSYLKVLGRDLLTVLGDTDLIGLGAESPYGGFGPLAFGEAIEGGRGPVAEAEFVVTGAVPDADRDLDLHWIPPVTNNIPEFSFVPAPSEVPGLVRGGHGRGRVAYLPWLAGRLVAAYAPQRLAALLVDLVRGIGSGSAVFEVDAPSSVETTLQRLDDGGSLVHLINATGLHGPSRQIVPVGPIRLRLDGSRGVRTLRAGAQVGWRDGWATIDRLERFEALVFE